MEEGYQLPAPVEEDIYEMSAKDRAAHEIDSLPGSLGEAVAVLEQSSLLKDALGEHIFTKFVENKKKEWDDYRIQVTEYEINKYLPLL
jgi:glutamine synthetase